MCFIEHTEFFQATGLLQHTACGTVISCWTNFE